MSCSRFTCPSKNYEKKLSIENVYKKKNSVMLFIVEVARLAILHILMLMMALVIVVIGSEQDIYYVLVIVDRSG